MAQRIRGLAVAALAAVALLLLACEADGGRDAAPMPSPSPTAPAMGTGGTGTTGGSALSGTTTPPDAPVSSTPLTPSRGYTPPASPPITSTPAGPVAADRTEVLAPIDRVEVMVAESFPPQYFVHVTSGLPSGCARFSRIDVARTDPRSWNIEVYNTMPRDPLIVCTMIYGTLEHSIPLGSGLEAGAVHTVVVNGQAHAFTAQ
jgi:hypothetical protein